jgi:hypothetical protein
MLAAARELRRKIAPTPKRSDERRQLRAELEKLRRNTLSFVLRCARPSQSPRTQPTHRLRATENRRIC